MNQPLASLKIIWICFLNALLIYAGIGYYFSTVHQGPAIFQSWNSPFLAILLFISAVESIMVLLLIPKPLFRSSSYQTHCILRWAIAESIGVLGLVLIFSHQISMPIFLLIIVWSAGLLLMRQPTAAEQEQYERLAKENG